MAEEEKVDPEATANRIVRSYLSALIWSREQRRVAVERTMSLLQREQYLKKADEWVLKAEEDFGREVDYWRKKSSRSGREIIRRIVDQLDKRQDLSFFGRQIVEHCKIYLEKGPVSPERLKAE